MKLRANLDGLIFLAASIVVLVMAARGQLTSVMLFPWVFGAVLLVIGMISLAPKGDAPRTRRTERFALFALAATVSCTGGVLQNRLVAQRLEQARTVALASLSDSSAPILDDLIPVNFDGSKLPRMLSFDGRVTLLSFWSTSCSPCRAELPELNALQAKHGGDGLQVLAITRWYGGDHAAELEKIERFVAKYELDLPVCIDDTSKLHAAYSVRALPSTVLIDREGSVVDYGAGLQGGRRLIELAGAMLAE